MNIYDYFNIPSTALDRDQLVLLKFMEEFKTYPAVEDNMYDLLARVLATKNEIEPERIPEISVRPKFSARVLYTRGLGPQFFDIAAFEADNPTEAKAMAETKAKAALGDNWTEVKIKPVF